MSELGIAIVKVAHDLTVLDNNDLAARYFSFNGAVSIRGGKLFCQDASQQPLLLQATLAACTSSTRSIIKLREHLSDELTLVLQPRHNATNETGAAQHCLLFLKPAPATLLRISRDALSANFGITQAESEILSMMMRGASTHDMAKMRRTSSETIRSQVKNLCAKTGSKGQVGLMAFASKVTTTVHQQAAA